MCKVFLCSKCNTAFCDAKCSGIMHHDVCSEGTQYEFGLSCQSCKVATGITPSDEICKDAVPYHEHILSEEVNKCCRCSKANCTLKTTTGLYFCSEKCAEEVIAAYRYEDNREQITSVFEMSEAARVQRPKLPRWRDDESC